MFVREANQAIADSLINCSNAGIVADSTATYLHEINQLPLLTAEEEKSLGICIKHGTKDEAKKAIKDYYELQTDLTMGRGTDSAPMLAGGYTSRSRELLPGRPEPYAPLPLCCKQ